MEFLQIKNLSFKYPNTNEYALDNISLNIKNGEFVLICGETGCGKTTLLRMLKREIAPFGAKTGDILFDGINQDDIDSVSAASEIGFVFQNPESQVVTDKVWHELAFGLESLGIPSDVIRRRVGEIASYFGIGDWFHEKTSSLSGGQKQLLNLASILVMQPKLILLDEPTGQLDPIAASDFITTIHKLNKETGITVVMVEHRLEEVYPIADRIIVMDKGRVLADDTPRNTAEILNKQKHSLSEGLPSATRIFNMLGGVGECPLTVKEGKTYLSNSFTNRITAIEKLDKIKLSSPILEMKDVFFKYDRQSDDILKNFKLCVNKGEILCILGANGSGKTTALNVLSGLLPPYRGTIKIKDKKLSEYKNNELYNGNLALLPQNPQTVFMKDTVFEDLSEICKAKKQDKEVAKQKIYDVAERTGIQHLLEKHPYDLSGGEQQKAALAKMLLLEPQILLLDEPTKGIDAQSKKTIAAILKALKKEAITIVFVTHDIEFAATIADRCALFFDGEITSCHIPSVFFADNSFYTTAANRISRHMYKNAVTTEDVVFLCEKNKL